MNDCMISSAPHLTSWRSKYKALPLPSSLAPVSTSLHTGTGSGSGCTGSGRGSGTGSGPGPGSGTTGSGLIGSSSSATSDIERRIEIIIFIVTIYASVIFLQPKKYKKIIKERTS